MLSLQYSSEDASTALAYTVRGKILEGENFGESMLLKLLARKNLANLPAVNQKILLVSRLVA